MAELLFDAATHTYTVDGRRIPSVTQVLEDVGIIDYSFLPPRVRQMALDRGRDVHTLTHFDDEGDLDETSVKEEHLGYLTAWRRFRADWDIPAWDLIEWRQHDELGYAGTLDRFLRSLTSVSRGTIAGALLVDIKTNQIPWWCRVQLAAYKRMVDRTEDAQSRRIGVELHGDGTYRTEEYPLVEQRADFATFAAALRVCQEKAKHK